MLTRLSESAFPHMGPQATPVGCLYIPGLTVREYIATQILAGMFASSKAPELKGEWLLPPMVEGAVVSADALIERLWKK